MKCFLSGRDWIIKYHLYEFMQQTAYPLRYSSCHVHRVLYHSQTLIPEVVVHLRVSCDPRNSGISFT